MLTHTIKLGKIKRGSTRMESSYYKYFATGQNLLANEGDHFRFRDRISFPEPESPFCKDEEGEELIALREPSFMMQNGVHNYMDYYMQGLEENQKNERCANKVAQIRQEKGSLPEPKSSMIQITYPPS
jgi:hypothetical protein